MIKCDICGKAAGYEYEGMWLCKKCLERCEYEDAQREIFIKCLD